MTDARRLIENCLPILAISADLPAEASAQAGASKRIDHD
jgi:hypothetical protein